MSKQQPVQHVASLWAASARPAPKTTSLAGQQLQADVVVIGAGISGLSAAVRLAETGVDVVVLEAAEIGWGASGRNNGQVIPCLSRADPSLLVQTFGETKGRAFVELIRDSASITFDLIRKYKIECEAVQNGWLQPAHTLGRVELAKARYKQWRSFDAPVELLSQDQANELTGSTCWFGGWHNPTGGHINPLGYVRGMAEAAMKMGARIFTQSPAVGIAADGTGWKVSTAAGSIRARKIIIATQSYGNQFSSALWPGLPQTVVPVRSYQMATKPMSAELRKKILPHNHAMSDTHGDLHFCRFDGEGRLVTGGALVFGYDYANRLQSFIGERMMRLFPAITNSEDVRFDYVWHGNIGMSADAVPHVHKLVDGVYAWLGDNGRGVALSSALGGALADAVRGVPEDTLPLPFMEVKPIPMHALSVKMAPLGLVGYRIKDRMG